MEKTDFDEICDAFGYISGKDYNTLSRKDLIADIMSHYKNVQTKSSISDKKKWASKITGYIYRYFYIETCKVAYKKGKHISNKLICEAAYKEAFNTVSSAGIVDCEVSDGKLLVYALDPSVLLQFTIATGSPRLYMFLEDEVRKELGFTLGFRPYETPVYEDTKYLLQNTYDMISEGIISWEEVFNLNDLPQEATPQKNYTEKMVCKGNWSWEKLLSHNDCIGLEKEGFLPIEDININCCHSPEWEKGGSGEKRYTFWIHDHGRTESGGYIKYTSMYCRNCRHLYYAVTEIGGWSEEE